MFSKMCGIYLFTIAALKSVTLINMWWEVKQASPEVVLSINLDYILFLF